MHQSSARYPGRPPVEVTTKLGEVFNPICFAIADDIHQQVATGNTAALMEAARSELQFTMPNTEAAEYLDWDVFEPLTAEELTQVQHTPPGQNGPIIDKIEEAYAQKHPDRPLRVDDPVFPMHSPTGRMLQHSIGYIRGTWDYENDAWENPPLNITQWKAFEAQVAALSPEDLDTFNQMQGTRRGNLSKWRWHDPRMRRTEAIFFLHNPHVENFTITSNLVMPIGDYGEDFAQLLTNCGAAIQTYTEQHSAEQIAQATEGNEALLLQYTGRAAENKEANAVTTARTTQEGILSVVQSIAILTAQKVEGYDDPLKLTADLVKSGLIARLVRYAPMGLVGPMALGGYYFPGAIVRTEKGLAFSNEFETYLKEGRMKRLGEFTIERTYEPKAEKLPDEIGRMCPAVEGAQAIAEAQVALMQAHTSQETSKT